MLCSSHLSHPSQTPCHILLGFIRTTERERKVHLLNAIFDQLAIEIQMNVLFLSDERVIDLSGTDASRGSSPCDPSRLGPLVFAFLASSRVCDRPYASPCTNGASTLATQSLSISLEESTYMPLSSNPPSHVLRCCLLGLFRA